MKRYAYGLGAEIPTPPTMTGTLITRNTSLLPEGLMTLDIRELKAGSASAAPTVGSSRMVTYAVVGAVAVVGIILYMRLRKRRSS